jgi:8-oxo-dGTP diphosphatase
LSAVPGAPRPVVGVSVFVRKDDAVLLVRRARPPFAGMWSFPGGHVEWGERLADAAIREVREETGVSIDQPARIDTIEFLIPGEAGIGRHIVLLVFEGRYIGGDVVAADDAADARWVPVREIASLDVTREARDIILRIEAAR